jgi:hypothetical protein
MRTSYLLRIGLALLGAWAASATGAQAQCGPVTSVISSVVRTPVLAGRVYSLAALVEGDHYFSDRNTPGSHILVTIPAVFQCAQWVKTPNDDKDQTSTALVQLQLAQSAVVHVGFDNRAAAPPTWLGEAFQDTGLSIGIAETGTQTAFRVWKKTFPAGTVVLGGNSAPGSSFPSGKSNYVIFALPDQLDPNDLDGDGVENDADNCPSVANPGQEDGELRGNFSDPVPDGVGDACDNCPPVSDTFDPNFGRDHNTSQRDLDGDGTGDLCDSDVDGDGVLDEDDNCLYTPNPGQQPGSGAAGSACELPGLPHEVHGLDVTQTHHFAVEMDILPPRAEVRIELLPESRNLDVEVDVECSGDPMLQRLCDDGSAGTPRHDCFRFPRPVAFKVDGNDVVQPIHLQPSSIFDPSQPQPKPGEWVVPFFVYMMPSAFSPLPDLDLICFVEIRPLPGSDATGTFGVRLSPRVKPAASELIEYFQDEIFQGQVDVNEEGEYGFFTPDGVNFTLLNSGNPTLGQCVLTNAELGEGQHVPVTGARGWNCCTFTYQTADFDFPHGGPFESERGHAAIFVGALPADAEPDLDGDVILDFCDNCPLTVNSIQDDADADGVGDSCDNCPAVSNANQANGDAVPAGDACQCIDVNASGAGNLADVVMMRRYLAGRTNPASFDAERCVLASGPFPCDPLGALLVRRTLAGASPPLVQNCP